MSEVTPIIRPDGSVVIPIYNEQTGSATPIEDVSPEKVAYISQADKDKLDSISVSSLVYIETLESTASELLIQIDSKQPSGDYSVSGHTHSISAVDNLQSELDSKQPSGNYSVSGHTHAISAVDNLQSELDSKQPSGDYSVSGHTHSISAVDNLQSELDSKQPSGNYSVSGHTHSTTDITDLSNSLNLKLDKTTPIQNFNTSFTSNQVSSGNLVNVSTTATCTLNTYTDYSEGFQFGIMATGGPVTFSGSFFREGTGSVLAAGKTAYVVRIVNGWQIGGTLS